MWPRVGSKTDQDNLLLGSPAALTLIEDEWWVFVGRWYDLCFVPLYYFICNIPVAKNSSLYYYNFFVYAKRVKKERNVHLVAVFSCFYPVNYVIGWGPVCFFLLFVIIGVFLAWLLLHFVLRAELEANLYLAELRSRGCGDGGAGGAGGGNSDLWAWSIQEKGHTNLLTHSQTVS